MPKIILLQCWAQVIDDEITLFLRWKPTAVDEEVDVVAISRFILSAQSPDIDAFALVGLQETAIWI